MAKIKRNPESHAREMRRRKEERSTRVSGQLFALNSGGYLALSPHARGHRFYRDLIGRSKYTFKVLPAIRAREVNFRGERQR